jgi:protein O-GlcNAc transferase
VRLISFSLWGANPKYLEGAIRNAELAAQIYPGWILRYYCGASVPEPILACLESFAHVKVVRMIEPGDWRGLFWRFYPASESDVSVMLSRDADSRLNLRERAAVDEWLRSDQDFHVMRDHRSHNLPILGGMWGVRNGMLREMRRLIEVYPIDDSWQTDQQFLALAILPLVRDRWFEHDEYRGRPFPTALVDGGFVGQPFDECDRPLMQRLSWSGWQMNRMLIKGKLLGRQAGSHLKHRLIARLP